MNKLTTQDKQLTESTDKPEFKPTPHMIVWLDTVIKTDSDVVDEISRISGIDESTYYKWLKQDGFLEWFEKERQRMIKAQAWRLDNMGMKRAKRSDKVWEIMQKRVGNIKEDAPTNAVQINNNVSVDKYLEDV